MNNSLKISYGESSSREDRGMGAAVFLDAMMKIKPGEWKNARRISRPEKKDEPGTPTE